MRFRLCLVLFATSLCSASAQKLVHLSCDVPAQADTPGYHLDFTLNESAHTVSFFVDAFNTMNVAQASFTESYVTWSQELAGIRNRRSINRSTLEFIDTEEEAQGMRSYRGTCKLADPPPKQF